MNKTLVITHISADFDACASAYAAGILFQPSIVVLPGSPNRNVREFLSLHADLFRFVSEGSVIEEEIAKVVITDTQSLNRIGKLGNILNKSGVKTKIFDHHMTTEDALKPDKAYIERIGSTTTLMIEKIKKANINISEAEATLMALGIHEDTGSLTFKSTTARDANALSYLYSIGARPEVIYKFLHTAMTEEQHKLFTSLLDRMNIRKISGISVLTSTSKTSKYIDGASSVVHRLMDIENTDVVVVAINTDEKTHLILRSRKGFINCLKIAGEFSPGGHPEAATAVIEDTEPEQVVSTILKNIKKDTKPVSRISEFMTTNVRTLSPDENLKKVRELMSTYGHNGFPVTRKGEIVGMITRAEVDKALKHDLAHAPVKGFMTRKVFTISPQDTVDKAMKIMIENRVGRLPVISNNKLVGIITRTDILKVLHGEKYYEKEPFPDRGKLLRRFETNLPDKIKEVIRLAGYISDELGLKSYLVGGIVRDLILGYKNPDIDIVIENDAVKVASKVTAAIGGRMDAYRRFKTAVVILPDGERVDFATARTELYEEPGALPKIELSPIEADLLRRDFTINAIAMSISRKDFGQLLDVVGGIKDLEKRVIKVLHSLSFIEDPTRIIRAVRFEKRFGFSMDKTTLTLANEAVSMGIIKRSKGVRLREEIMDILKEENVLDCLDRLKELEILKQLDKKIKYTPNVKRKIRSFLSSVKRQDFEGIKVNKALNILSILVLKFSGDELSNFLNSLKFKRKIISYVVSVNKMYRYIRKLPRMNPEEYYFYLSKYPIEAVFLIYSILRGDTKSKKILFKYLKELRHIKLSISGNDIIKLGVPESPLVGKIKNETLKAKIRGAVKTKEQEIKFIKELINKGE